MKLFLRPVLVVLALATFVAGCDMLGTFGDSMAHGKPSAAEIEAAVGTKPDVFSAGTGSVLVVTVQLSEVPAASLSQLETLARAAIVHEYKKEPTTLTLSFICQKDPFGR